MRTPIVLLLSLFLFACSLTFYINVSDMRVPKGNGWNAKFRNLFNSVRNKNSGGLDAKARRNSSSYMLAKSLDEGMGQSGKNTHLREARTTLNSSRKAVFTFSETIRHARDGFKDLDDKLNQVEKEYMDKLLGSRGGAQNKANTPAPPATTPSPTGEAKREIKAHDAETRGGEASEMCMDITGGEEGYWEAAENETMTFHLVGLHSYALDVWICAYVCL
jgi:hypothetical protein